MQSIPPRAHIPIGLLVAGAIVVLIPIIGILVWLYMQWTALDLALPWLTMAMRVCLFAAPPIYVGTLAWRWLGVGRRIDHLLDTVRAMAEHRQGARATTLHYEVNSESVASEVLSLPAPIEVVKPLAEWLEWVDAQPHCLLSGRTKAGKTHTATAILARRLRASEAVYIIDPHSSAWLGLPTVGFVGMRPDGKPDTTALHAALLAVASEYVSRMRARDEHKNATGDELPHDHFGRMTILIDEANYIADVLPTFWREFIKALASGGRKVGIALVCLVQSPLVEDIQVSGGMRANFARLALDDQTVKQLIGADEKDSERKKALHAALAGQERPAAATIDAQVWLLDRRNLEAGAAPSNARALVWSGDHAVVPEPPAPLAKTEPLPTPGTGSGTTQDENLADTAALEPLVRRMAEQQFSRNQMATVLGGNRQKTLAFIRAVLGDAS